MIRERREFDNPVVVPANQKREIEKLLRAGR
jgi:hypothetical protein